MWRPIETWPVEEDAELLVYGGFWDTDMGGWASSKDKMSDHSNKISFVEYYDNTFYVMDTCYYSCRIVDPTHWMPAPGPPK